MKIWEVLAVAHRDRAFRVSTTLWAEHPAPEDLEHFALGQTQPEEGAKIESHLEHCERCRKNSEEANIFAARLREVLRAQGREHQRQAVRYQVRESAIVTLCRPAELVPVIGQAMDVSTSGLRIRLPRNLHRGAQLQIQVENAVVFGTVRRSLMISAKEWDVGVAIDQVVMRAQQYSTRTSAREQFKTTKERRSSGADPIEILLVEDSPADAKLMEFLFEDLKVACRVTVVEDGAQALTRLLDPGIPKPNLVLLDLNLPRVNGIEVLKRLRQEVTTDSVAVAVLSSSTASVDLQRSTALGICAYLPKPDNITDYADLRTRLDALVTDTVQ